MSNNNTVKDVDGLCLAKGPGVTLAAINNAPELTAPPSPFEDYRQSRRFDLYNPPPVELPTLLFQGANFVSPGNFASEQAKSKMGKTGLNGAIISAAMVPGEEYLGFVCTKPDGAVLHFDTEQSPRDHHDLVKRSLRRAGLTELPAGILSYCATGIAYDKAREWFFTDIEEAAEQFGGVRLVILDGCADLIADPNDQAEANAFVQRLHDAAIRFNTSIVTVIHENPGSEIGKTRGHLGSQIERKAQSNLRLEKDGDGVTVVYSDRSRHFSISKDHGLRFAWDTERQMHMPIETRARAKSDAKRAALVDLAEVVFEDAPSALLSWKAVHDRIEKVEGVGLSGARKKFDAMKAAGVLVKTSGGDWRLSK